MKIEVVAFQACKAEPDREDNKIAFTLNGHLCGVTGRPAWEIIKAAADDYTERVRDLDRNAAGHPMPPPPFRGGLALGLVAKCLAGRKDFTTIAKRC